MAKDSGNPGDSGKKGAAALLGAVSPLLAKIKAVDPKAAKTSATRGAAGTKDLVQMSVAYVKQETKAPLKNIGRYLGAGIGAALLFSTGSILVVLGLLRGIQAAWAYESHDGDHGPLSNTLSWVPYAIAVAGCVLVIGIAVMLFQRSGRKQARSGGAQ